MSSILTSQKRSLGFFALFIAITSMCFIACKQQEPTAPEPLSTLFNVSIGKGTAKVSIAYTQKEMSKGLMFIESMPENQGMLFYFNPPKQMGFWMRNTKIPLDIGFFDKDGILKEIYTMYPLDERSIKSRSNQLIIAIEMNKGWFAKNKIRPGAQLDLEELREAFESRGVSPAKILF